MPSAISLLSPLGAVLESGSGGGGGGSNNSGGGSQNPLDLSKYITAQSEQANKALGRGDTQYDWAKKQFDANRAVADTVQNRALDTSAQFKDAAARDRALYDRRYMPAMEQQLDYAQQYTTPERMAANRAQAITSGSLAANALRAASERNLQSIGVDPSSGRYAGLEAGLAAKQAAMNAGLATKSDRDTEMMGQTLLANAIKTGQVLPGQAVNEAGVSLAADKEAIDTGLATTASGSQTMGTPLQWQTLGSDTLKEWKNSMVAQTTAGMENQKLEMEREKQKGSESSGIGAIVGAGAGILGTIYGGPAGGMIGSKLGNMFGSAVDSGGAFGGSSSGGIFGTAAKRGGLIKKYEEGGAVEDDDDGEGDLTEEEMEELEELREMERRGKNDGSFHEYAGGGRVRQRLARIKQMRAGGAVRDVPEPEDVEEADWERRNTIHRGYRPGREVVPGTDEREAKPRQWREPHESFEVDSPESDTSYEIDPNHPDLSAQEQAEQNDNRHQWVPNYQQGGGVPGYLPDDNTDLAPPFDPEGRHYDDRTARIAGIQRGRDGHMESRDPVTGMQLKGRAHPTFDQAVETDRRLGYGLEKRDGRYYTVPFQANGGTVGNVLRDTWGVNAYADGGEVEDPPMVDAEELAAAGGGGGDVPNLVPPEASPSGGAATDDVHAMLNEGEFVIPKEVVSWHGEKFFQKLIQKAHDEMQQPQEAEPEAGPPQAMAISPPTFASQGG